MRGVIVFVMFAGMAQFDLQGGMVDTEALQQCFAGQVDECVMSCRRCTHDMRSQGDFFSAQ